MLRHYELTGREGEQAAPLLLSQNTGKPGRPPRDNRLMLNAMVWLARSGAAWPDLPERYGPWTSVYSCFRKWIDDGILDNIFRVLIRRGTKEFLMKTEYFERRSSSV